MIHWVRLTLIVMLSLSLVGCGGDGDSGPGGKEGSANAKPAKDKLALSKDVAPKEVSPAKVSPLNSGTPKLPEGDLGPDTHASVSELLLGNIKAFNDVMATVTDLPSAKVAKPKLEAIGAELKAIESRMEELGPPTGAQAQRLLVDFNDRTVRLTSELIRHVVRVNADPDIAAELKDALKTINPNN